jgi:hypothetical protein
MGFILLGLVVVTVYIICAAIVAEMVYFIWWAMGSPQISQHNHKQLTYSPGRLFNGYGKWLVEKYNSWESGEDERLFEKAVELTMDQHPNPSSNGFAIAAQKKFIDLDENERRVNPYKAFGGCIVCFSPHLSNLLLLPILLSLHFGLYPLPVWMWFLCFFFWWAVVLNFIH